MSKTATGPCKHAHLRSNRIVAALRKAIAAIEVEIDANEGIYPGGRLSQAELCRRAGVSKKTLQNASHKSTTLIEVNAWLKRIQKLMVTGRRSVRSKVTERVDHWKHEYGQLATHYNISRLEVADLEVTLRKKDDALAKTRTRIAALEAEALELRRELSEGKVVRMPTRSMTSQ